MEVSNGTGIPSTKDTKYDRQLRLWGARGQKALMEARILLVNAGPTGTEILKNLVLPGVGNFVVVDAKRITERDLANNFFVERKYLGHLRSQVVTELLAELNPDVSGEAKAVAPDALLRSDPDFFSSFSLIIATQLDPVTLRDLAALAWSKGVPLLVARSYGLLGYVRLVLPHHLILDSKSQMENKAVYNLCLARTLPAVQDMADSLDLATMDHAALSRVPYVVLLLKARELWQSRHGGQLPTSKTRAQFVEVIRELAMDPEDDNFKEAIKFAHLAYTAHEIPEYTQELFAHKQLDELSAQSADFWVVVRALKDFVSGEGGGRLPLSGAVPDMACSTEAYTRLQQAYRAKAIDDRHAVQGRVEALLESVGRPRDSISAEEVTEFCRNAYSLQALTTRSLEEELSSPNSAAVAEALMEADAYEAGSDMNPFLWYLGLRAVHRFFSEHKRYPGTVDQELHSDEVALWAHLQAVGRDIAQSGTDMMHMEVDIKREHAVELTRYGAAEIHNMAAILGGIGAQEAVKILTSQYVPLNHTFMYNGIASLGAVYQL